MKKSGVLIFILSILVLLSFSFVFAAVPNPGHKIAELETCANGQTILMSGGAWTCGNGAGGSQNLQQVTDVGSTTSNIIYSINGAESGIYAGKDKLDNKVFYGYSSLLGPYIQGGTWGGNLRALHLQPAGGYVGVGIQSDPAAELHVASNGEILRLEGKDHAYITYYPTGSKNSRGAYVGFPDTNVKDFYIRNEIGGNIILGGGNVGIGTETPGANLDVRGNVYVSGALVTADRLYTTRIDATSLYDSNDNSYYIDPNIASKVNQLTANSVTANSVTANSVTANSITLDGVARTRWPIVSDIPDQAFNRGASDSDTKVIDLGYEWLDYCSLKQVTSGGGSSDVGCTLYKDSSWHIRIKDTTVDSDPTQCGITCLDW